MNADHLSKEHVGTRVRITRVYAHGPHIAVGDLQGIRHSRESTEVDLNVLGENVHLLLTSDEDVELLQPGQ